MRIWSVHPQYLDTKGLLALWRETLLAKNVLEGKTKGYKNHPQLLRFKQCDSPTEAINQYLKAVFEESVNRGYKFDIHKFKTTAPPFFIDVTTGQVNFEKSHLLNKLLTRDHSRHQNLLKIKNLEIHPLFRLIEGNVAEWEVIK